MAATTYITSTEANRFYPNDSAFSSGQRSSALSASKGLVDSFVNSKIPLPVLGDWDGESAIEAPYVLKVAQSRFYRHILEFANVGETDDLNALWENTVEMLRSLREGELDIPSLVYESEAGWHIANTTRSSDVGGVWVRGAAPTEYRYHYRIVVTSSGTNYVDSVRYSVYRSDSSTAVLTGQVASFAWQYVLSMFEIRFDGQWTLNDEVRIVGIPSAAVNAPGAKTNYIEQGIVW